MLQPRSRYRTPLLVVLAVAALLLEGHALFVQQHGAPDTRGWRTLWTEEISGSKVVSQTFRVAADGWYEFAFRARPAGGGPVAGDAVLELVDATTTGSDVGIVRRVVPAAEVVKDRWYRVGFPPVASPRDRLFRFVVSLPQTPPNAGISLATTRENDYRNGSLFVGRERWPDLVFTTRAHRATVFGNLGRLWKDRPWAAALFWLGLAIYNLALGCFAWHVVATPDQRDRNGRSEVQKEHTEKAGNGSDVLSPS